MFTRPRFEYEYEDPTLLTLALIGVLALFVVLAEMGIWATFLQIDLLRQAFERGHVLAADLAHDEERRALVAGLQLFAAVAAAGLFLRWLHRMSANARALIAPDMRHGPLGAVAWFLVPVLNLWKPLGVLRELFQASNPDHVEDWRFAPAPHLLSLAWTLWLLFQLTLGLALVADVWATTLPEVQTAAWGKAIVGVVAAPLGIAVAICAWRLRGLQRARYGNTAPLRVQRPWPTRSTGDAEPAS